MKQRIEAAQALLKWLSVHGVPAVICGGYARDTIFSKEIKDIDISVSDRHYTFVASQLGDLDANRSSVQMIDTDPRYVHANIAAQEEFELVSNLDFGLPTRTINLIGQTCLIDGPTVTDRINFGICKAYIDLDGISVTDDFRADYRDKQITLLRTDWGLEGSMKHFLRLQKKYPWPLRVRAQEEDIKF